MSKNDDLINALQSPKLLTIDRHKEALNALLLAGNELSGIRKALIAHKHVWKKFDGLDDDNSYKDDDDLLAADGLSVFIQKTAKARVLAGLKTASEPVLSGLIEAATENDLRAKLVSDAANKTAFGLTIPDSTQTDLITDEVARDIQLQAQRALLEKKIEPFNRNSEQNDAKKILDLLTAIDEEDDVKFKAALTALNIRPTSAQKMTDADVGELIKSDLAVKCFEVNCHNIFDEHYSPYAGDLKASDELKKDDAAFIAALPAPYGENIEATDANAITIKAILGERFLRDYIAANNDSVLLKAIANTTKADQLTGLLKNTLDRNDKFLKHSVYESILPVYRHLAAERVLALKIAEGVSIESLSMLVDAENHPAFLTVLKNSADLGFSSANEQELRTAFLPEGFNHIKAVIKAAAHVSLNLGTGNTNQVSNFIASQDAPFYASQYNTLFKVADAEKDLFNAYFEKPENLSQARQLALVNVVKAQLFDMTDEQVGRLANSPNADDLRGKVAGLPGLNNSAIKGLITKDTYAEGVGRLLRAHAKAEQMYREASASDLNDEANYASLIAKINKLDMGNSEVNALTNTLPLPDKHNVQVELTELLVRNLPEKKAASLNLVAKAKTLEDFKLALEQLGVNQHDWITANSMERVQKAALSRAIALKINEYSTIGAYSRPELLELLNTLPLAKQQALLADPSPIPAVINTRSLTELGQILHIPVSDLKGKKELIAEYDRIIFSKKIDNVIIGTILARQPGIELDEEKVRAINEFLAGNEDAFINHRNFITSIESIKNIVKPINESTFNEAFGLNAEGSEVSKNIGKFINIQHQFNIRVFMQIHALSHNASELPSAHFFATLSKGAELTADQMEHNLWAAFKDSTSKDDLIKKVKDNQTDALNSDTLRSLEEKLTVEKYNELKRPFNQAKFLDVNTSSQLIQSDAAVLREQSERLRKITEADQGVTTELNRLAKLDGANWLNPAFQSATKQNAKELEPHFKTLATTCDIIVDQLKHQKDVVLEQWLSLPTSEQLQSAHLTPPQKRAIENHRNDLYQQYQVIKAEYAMHSSLQKILNGNPDNETEFGKKGVLKLLEEAKDPKQEIKFLGYASTYKDYPKSEKAAHLEAGWVGKKADAIQSTMEITGNLYEATPDNLKVQPGYFREHTIGAGKAEGHFIEERGENDLAPHRVNGKVEYTPNVKLTVNKFPEEQRGNPSATHHARVEFGLAMAGKILAHYTKPPSPKEPIRIGGSDPVKLQYMWTALVVLGVDPKAIKVVSTVFDPDNHLGFFNRVNDTFIVQGQQFDFKSNPTVKLMKKTLNELKQDKSASQNEMKDISEALMKTTQRYKQMLGDNKVLKEIDEDNKKRPPTTRLGG
jgi:hypothetical protein